MLSPMTAPGWRAELLRRARWHVLLKFAGISAFMALFFAAYFHVLRNPVYPVSLMPLTALDHAIGFAPHTVWAYFSLWVYVGIPPGLMLSLREALGYGVWMAGLCATGLAAFYFWPTAVPAADLAAAAQHGAFALMHGVDAAGNACPSLHVATAAFTAVWVQRALRCIGAPLWLQAANVLWLVAIVHSTLATKQHVALDAAAGLLLAAVFAIPSLRWQPASFVPPPGR